MAKARARATLDTGVEPVGTYRFGDSAALSDELLDLVLRGPKRATAFAEADVEQGGAPYPEPGQHWLLLDGAGQAHCVARVDEVTSGPLYTVDAAFAWETGWRNRTRTAWIAAHEAYLRRQGFTDLEAERVLFIRFSVVWPEADEPHWWAADVRELRGHEPAPDSPRPDLPALAAFDGERVTGVLRFEPEPGDLRLVAVVAEDAGVESRLREAFEQRRRADRSLR